MHLFSVELLLVVELAWSSAKYFVDTNKSWSMSSNTLSDKFLCFDSE